MSYLKIPNLYKQQDILLFRECYALEKIDGTSTHISWNNGRLDFFSGGERHEKFVSLFNKEELVSKFTEQFGVEDTKVIVYGEAYGGKCQGMKDTYGPNLRFIAFDVLVEDYWLSVPRAEQVVLNLGLEFVDYVKIPTDLTIIDAQRDADSVQAVRNGMGIGHPREGVVLRPLIELTKNNGERIIAKHKGEAFAERRNTPKVVDGNKAVILTRAQEIADEWVVHMRLEHILQKHPEYIGMEHTRDLISAMVEDVYREAKGEIVESREVSAAIGRKTVELWKKHLKSKIGV